MGFYSRFADKDLGLIGDQLNMPQQGVNIPDYGAHSSLVSLPTRELIKFDTPANYTYLVDPVNRVSVLTTHHTLPFGDEYFSNGLNNLMTTTRMAKDNRYPMYSDLFLKFIGGIQKEDEYNLAFQGAHIPLS